MSMQSEPITAELDALPENPAFDEEPVFDHEIESTDDELENRRELTHDEYDSLEEAVMQTARGRTFLREHARRNRAIAQTPKIGPGTNTQNAYRHPSASTARGIR